MIFSLSKKNISTKELHKARTSLIHNDWQPTQTANLLESSKYD